MAESPPYPGRKSGGVKATRSNAKMTKKLTPLEGYFLADAARKCLTLILITTVLLTDVPSNQLSNSLSTTKSIQVGFFHFFLHNSSSQAFCKLSF